KDSRGTRRIRSSTRSSSTSHVRTCLSTMASRSARAASFILLVVRLIRLILLTRNVAENYGFSVALPSAFASAYGEIAARRSACVSYAVRTYAEAGARQDNKALRRGTLLRTTIVMGDRCRSSGC